MTDEEYWKYGTDRFQENYDAAMEVVEAQPAWRKDALKRLLDSEIGERFWTAPASTRKTFHSAFPAGLLTHSVNVLKAARKLNVAFDNYAIDSDLSFCALFHDLGKAGNIHGPLYIQAEEWKQRRGEQYEINRQIQWMTNPDRALSVLQHYGVRLLEHEWLAIKLSDGPAVDENRPYAFKEPTLAEIVRMADSIATRSEKDQAGVLVAATGP